MTTNLGQENCIDLQMWTVRRPWTELLGCVLTVTASRARFSVRKPNILSMDLSIPGKVTFISGYSPLSFIFWLQQLSVLADLLVTVSTIYKWPQISWYAVNCHFAETRIGKSHTLRLGVVTLVSECCCLPIVAMPFTEVMICYHTIQGCGDSKSLWLHLHKTQGFPLCARRCHPPHPLLIRCPMWAISSDLTSSSYNTFPGQWQNFPGSQACSLCTVISNKSGMIQLAHVSFSCSKYV